MDGRTGPHFEDNGPKEEDRISYCPTAEAYRGRNPAKSIFYGRLARLSGLRWHSSLGANAPLRHSLRAFITLFCCSCFGRLFGTHACPEGLRPVPSQTGAPVDATIATEAFSFLAAVI